MLMSPRMSPRTAGATTASSKVVLPVHAKQGRRLNRAVTVMDVATPMVVSGAEKKVIIAKPEIAGRQKLRTPRPGYARAHTMKGGLLNVMQAAADAAVHGDGKGLVDAMKGKEGSRGSIRRAKTVGAERFERVTVSVVAPGSGSGCNAQAYAALSNVDGIELSVKGKSRAPYDRYPPAWGNDGAPSPNLETFAIELLEKGLLEATDCLVVGSRGGQVVLPTFWRTRGVDVPPAVIMNGGCAMAGPMEIQWPETAVTFLLLGGQDYFKQHHSNDSYLADAQGRVPSANSSTAILFVNEMGHMPQTELLMAVLHHMIYAVTSWKNSGQAPRDQFHKILKACSKRWSGNLTFKDSPGGTEVWQSTSFP